MSQHAFHDPIHPDAEVVLHVPPQGVINVTGGVAHPSCNYRAVVSPNLDAYYCSECGWSGRISGAWFMDKWRARAAVTDGTGDTP